MQIFETLYQKLLDFAKLVPVEIYTIVGPFVEEIISPIPSPLVMASAGSIAAAQDKTYVYLLYLALLGSVGKTIASWLLYLIADKFEDFAVGKLGRFIGVTSKEIESIGKKFSGTKKDLITIFLSRAIPIIPSSPISLVSGLIKVDLKNYIWGTFFGSIIRNLSYLYFGYAGLNAYKSTLEGLDSIESIVQVLIALAFLGFFGFLYYKKKKGAGINSLKNKKSHS